jgi:magnesium-transporting ATPase (P-type)
MGTTAVLVGIMAGQLGNLLSTRTGLHSVFSSNPLKNVWIPLGILVQLVMLAAVVYAPFLQPIFGTAALNPEYWVYLYILALGVILLEEIRKYVTKKIIWSSRRTRDSSSTYSYKGERYSHLLSH